MPSSPKAVASCCQTCSGYTFKRNPVPAPERKHGETWAYCTKKGKWFPLDKINTHEHECELWKRK
ncbi:hypothetical protein Dalk_4599 [Desulfatibacillum aliphaticivorans]|uniref:Uncharacterized protein n=1 Tax=Desulfatibacillum aliphaticivorans TaxID=218208 RepID=B8FNJ6_DESAL|nr:hypothetical protein [Desulfatibacillum aliphaticivorans]ACL06277.1 hypothetical protein Dalk_4599 [Desulfatibacillum aliphaticivorans]